MFSGSIPALVTPFRAGPNGAAAIDEGALAGLVDWQISQGSAALVACGTTGEAPTLAIDEHYRVIEVVIAAVAGRVPVIAGCGSNDTATAMRHMAFAAEAGAAAALVVAPYYNKPSQAGMIAHFSALADASDLPILLYNVPSRTVADILPETVVTLAERFSSIVGIKDASGDPSRTAAQRRIERDDFVQLSGNDDCWLGHRAAGGAGCISVTANVAPKLCAGFDAACAKGDFPTARAIEDKLYPLHKAMFADASPGPVKYALSRVRPGFPDALRLPLIAPSEIARRAVDAALAEAGLG